MIDRRIERAPSIEVSSSGDSTACTAASIARCSPTPMPIPSSAVPASDMIVRTSAKSRLIRPGSVIRSEMPCTPWRRTSSATLNASTIVVCLSSTWSRREFGTTISVSTSCASSSTPTSAWSIRREPSNENGFVTIPTDSAPTSLASRATMGAAPVPVPPPAPAVMKIMSAPFSRLLMRSYSSSADWRPSSGSDPDPSPRVTSLPMCSVTCARECSSDCRSVLIEMNSTPSTPASIMRSTALTPAPPTPTTRRIGFWIGWRPADGSHCRGGSSTFSGMSGEKTSRRRSSGGRGGA